MSNLNVLVRTGHGRIVVPVTTIEYDEVALDAATLVIPDIKSLWVDEEEATNFLYDYADIRKLNLLFDGDGVIFGLFNARHDSFRRVTFSDKGVDLFEFIEPEFVIL